MKMTNGKMMRVPVMAGMVTVLSASAALAHGSAMGKGPGPMGPFGGPLVKMEPMLLVPLFDEIDADGDGEITPEEMAAYGQARFAAADTDGDGLLSHEEAVAFITARMQVRIGRVADRLIARRDSNGDGRLSPDELAPPAERRKALFARLDTDGNGAISVEEAKAARERCGDPGHRRGPVAPAEAPENAPAPAPDAPGCDIDN